MMHDLRSTILISGQSNFLEDLLSESFIRISPIEQISSHDISIIGTRKIIRRPLQSQKTFLICRMKNDYLLEIFDIIRKHISSSFGVGWFGHTKQNHNLKHPPCQTYIFCILLVSKENNLNSFKHSICTQPNKRHTSYNRNTWIFDSFDRTGRTDKKTDI
jgi:hypothetical protein